MNEQLRTSFRASIAHPTDINEHLEYLADLSRGSKTIVELGTRYGVSTIAFLYAEPKKLICVDSNHDADTKKRLSALPNVTKLTFIDGDSREVDIPECDVLFIDTLHTYAQLKVELAKHGNKAKNYIAFHDTNTFGEHGEDGTEGICRAIHEFTANSEGQWEHFAYRPNNNGLTVLKRIGKITPVKKD